MTLLLLFALACADEEPVEDTGLEVACIGVESRCLLSLCCDDERCWYTDGAMVWVCETGDCDGALHLAERECR